MQLPYDHDHDGTDDQKVWINFQIFYVKSSDMSQSYIIQQIK